MFESTYRKFGVNEAGTGAPQPAEYWERDLLIDLISAYIGRSSRGQLYPFC